MASLRAASVPDPNGRDTRAVIQAQLDALADDDAPRAFSFSSPAILSRFDDAATFMAMVQTVRLNDRNGRSWLASYQRQRQADRSWRIDDCMMAPDSGKSST